MGLAAEVYDRMPVPAQHLMVSIAGYQRNRDRYGGAYRRHLSFLRDFDGWSLGRKSDYQKAELRRLILYAYEHSPYYRRLYEDCDIATFSGVADLARLPVVDKEMLRANIDEVTTVPRRGAVEARTGGTTGKSLVVRRTREDMMKRMAMLDHFKARVGFRHLEMRRATFNGKHIVPPARAGKVFWRYNHACRQMIYSSFHLTEENMEHYVRGMNEFKPDALDGFFTCMCDLASYIERHGIRLSFKPVAIFPTSETLTESGRELLERVFEAKVYDQYASSEGAPFVTECDRQVLHLELASGVFEPWEGGEVLVTSFTTYGTPLIRYRIGDCMRFADSDESCGCGNESPIVREIQGRRLEFLYTADGAKINAGNVSNLFKNMPNALIRAQAVQERMDEILILLEVDRERYRGEYDELLRDEFRHKFGSGSRIEIQHVDSIPRESSGKYRLILNRVPEPAFPAIEDPHA